MPEPERADFGILWMCLVVFGHILLKGLSSFAPFLTLELFRGQ